MTPKEMALTIVNRVASDRGLTIEQVFERNRDPACDAARIRAYRALKSELDWTQARIARLFGRTQQTISLALNAPIKVENIHERVEVLEDKLARLAGTDLHHAISAKLGFTVWKTIFFAILIEGYPRVLTRDAMVELYEEAAQSIGLRGAERSPDYVKSFLSRARADILDQGLPEPFVSVPPRGVVLTEEMAHWCAYNIGRPFIPSIAQTRVAARIQVARL